VVNCPALATAVQAANKPWVDLAQALGAFGPSANCSVSVETSGTTLQRLSSHLCPAVMVGMLGGGANLVNAPALAKAAGVAVQSTHSTAHAQCVVSVSFGGGRCVRGTVADGMPALVGVDGADFGAKGVELGGHLLLVEGEVAVVVQAVCAQGVRVVRLATAQGARGLCVAVHTDARVDAGRVPAQLLAQLPL
jgi:hypothetical protein